jgi:hypothetical protein
MDNQGREQALRIQKDFEDDVWHESAGYIQMRPEWRPFFFSERCNNDIRSKARTLIIGCPEHIRECLDDFKIEQTCVYYDYDSDTSSSHQCTHASIPKKAFLSQTRHLNAQ